jgi:hypothetical protein
MPLNIDTLSINKSVFNPDRNLMNAGQGITDLAKSSISTRDVDLKIRANIFATSDMQMRPDRIAYMAFGDLAKTGSILKFNSISNPFSVFEGQVFFIPDEPSINAMFQQKTIENSTSNTNTNPVDVFRKNQEEKIFKLSEGRKKFLESTVKNPPAQILPPNLAQPDEESTIRKEGYVVFAPNAGRGGFNG